jgi:hypothetical protein
VRKSEQQLLITISTSDLQAEIRSPEHQIDVLAAFLRHSSSIVMCIPIVRQVLCKHIPEEANARDNRMSIARQRISNQASLTIEDVFSAWSAQSDYKEGFS